jgi:hypothetical protein
MTIEKTVSAKHVVCNFLDMGLTGILVETAQTFNQGNQHSCSFVLLNLMLI